MAPYGAQGELPRTLLVGNPVNRGNGDKLTRAPLWTDETGPSNIGIL